MTEQIKSKPIVEKKNQDFFNIDEFRQIEIFRD